MKRNIQLIIQKSLFLKEIKLKQYLDLLMWKLNALQANSY